MPGFGKSGTSRIFERSSSADTVSGPPSWVAAGEGGVGARSLPQACRASTSRAWPAEHQGRGTEDGAAEDVADVPDVGVAPATSAPGDTSPPAATGTATARARR